MPPRRPSRSAGLPVIAAGAAITLLAAALCLWPPPLTVALEGRIFDSFLRSAPRHPATGDVAVVDIDEASLASVGQWPWPRYRVARLLTAIRERGAAAIGIDMVFAEPDRIALQPLSTEIRRDLGARIDVAGMPAEALDTDSALAKALSGGPFVLGYHFDFDAPGGATCVLHPLRAVVRSEGGAAPEPPVFDAPGVVCNLPALAAAAGSSGFFNVTPDADGVLRRVPLAIRHNGLLYPSLALALVLRARGGDVLLETGPEGLEAFRIDGRRIAVDRRGNLLVNYRGGRRTFPHISAAAVLSGSPEGAALAGKIVIVGTTATGLHEIRTTPLEAAQPGVEIHAAVVDNLLAADAIALPRWTRLIQVALVLLPNLLLTALMARRRAIWGLAAIVPATTCIWFGSRWLLAHHQLFLSPLMPIATLGLVFTLLTSFRFLQAEREVRTRTRKLSLTQDAIIQSLAALAETRHRETGGHIQRTRHYMRALSLRLRDHPHFRDYLDDDALDLLFRLAPLHDIGKVGVPDGILLKPDRLTPDEFDQMQRHALYGSETIRLAKSFLGDDSFLEVAEQIVASHHERWDGTGYPRGLKGRDIPVPGRLMSVADAYDAIISARGYKPALPHEEAIRIIVAERGSHFDPDVVDAFLAVQEEFRRIADRFSGGGVEPEPPAGY